MLVPPFYKVDLIISWRTTIAYDETQHIVFGLFLSAIWSVFCLFNIIYRWLLCLNLIERR